MVIHMSSYGNPYPMWLSMAGYGRLVMAGWPLLDLLAIMAGWQPLDLAGWSWLAVHGYTWLAMAGSGWLGDLVHPQHALMS